MLPVCLLAADSHVLRVCADPNNLPFSNEQGQGFENKLAELVASKLGDALEYTWWAERKSFVKNSLEAGRCDVIMGLPEGIDSAETTNPDYRSSYYLCRAGAMRCISIHCVTRDLPGCASECTLSGKTMRLQLSCSPGGHYTEHLGLQSIRCYGEANPAGNIIEAVDRGEIASLSSGGRSRAILRRGRLIR